MYCNEFLGDIAENIFACRYRYYHSVVWSRSCIVLKWQKILTQFLLHTTAPCLSQIVLKFGLHQSTHPPQILLQSDPPPVDFNIEDIRWQIAAEWLEIVPGFIGSLISPWKFLNFEKNSRPLKVLENRVGPWKSLKVLEKSLNLNVPYFEIFAY